MNNYSLKFYNISLYYVTDFANINIVNKYSFYIKLIFLIIKIIEYTFKKLEGVNNERR